MTQKLYETGIRKGFNGWQAWFTIDHQTFYLQPVSNKGGEEDREEKAEWYRKNLVIALDRLLSNRVNAAKQHAMDFAQFIATGNYEHECSGGGLTYWNEVDDPQLHGEEGPECLTTHQLYLLFSKNKQPNQ